MELVWQPSLLNNCGINRSVQACYSSVLYSLLPEDDFGWEQVLKRSSLGKGMP